MDQIPKSYSGTKDFLFDAAENIHKEMPGAMVFICVGVPNTVSTLAYTNILTSDDNGWDYIQDAIQDFKDRSKELGR